MIENNWENFLKNLGEWQGSFTSVSLTGELLESTPSLLTLEGLEDNQLVKFRVRRFATDDRESPISDYAQEYRTLGRQIVFFETGAFSKGTIQVAPFSEFGAEYGFVAENRRLRFVQLYDRQGNLSSQTLIREFRRGTNAQERPPLQIEQLMGRWEGTARVAYSDWQPSETCTTSLEIKDIGNGKVQQYATVGDRTVAAVARISGNTLRFEEEVIPRLVLLLPDGTSSSTPLHLNHRQAFSVELGWLVGSNERQRLIRSYDDKGGWVSATHIIEHRVS